MELTTKDWKEFRIGDLFRVEQLKRVTNNGGYVLDSDIIEINGVYPYLAAVSVNNGVKGYTNIKPNNEGNCITLSTTADSSNTVFYQPVDFIGRQQMAGIYATEKSKMNSKIAFFIITLLKKQLIAFNYNNKLTFKALKNIKLLLPSKNDEPDWDFMEEFIKEIEEENKEKLAVLKDVKPVDDEIDISDWHEFRVGDLFETLGGKRVPTGSYVKKAVLDANLGQIPRITVTGLNNGIDGYYNESINDSNYRIYENFISVTFLGDCFYQKHKASLDMKVHCLKLLNIDLNEKIALFLITTLKKEMLTYNYGDQLNSENLKDIILKLPSKNDQPDWEYMEDFITNQQEKIKNQLKELRR